MRSSCSSSLRVGAILRAKTTTKRRLETRVFGVFVVVVDVRNKEATLQVLEQTTTTTTTKIKVFFVSRAEDAHDDDDDRARILKGQKVASFSSEHKQKEFFLSMQKEMKKQRHF